MNDQQQANQHPDEHVVYERCMCREVLDQLRDRFGISSQVRRHLNNSRIELLKAIREVIDQRIEHLGKKAEQGTKISVE